MLTGSNAFAMRGADKTRENLNNAIQEAKNKFWNHMKSTEWVYDDKGIRLEKGIGIAEYNLYCYEYQDDRRRNWK